VAQDHGLSIQYNTMTNISDAATIGKTISREVQADVGLGLNRSESRNGQTTKQPPSKSRGDDEDTGREIQRGVRPGGLKAWAAKLKDRGDAAVYVQSRSPLLQHPPSLGLILKSVYQEGDEVLILSSYRHCKPWVHPGNEASHWMLEEEIAAEYGDYDQLWHFVQPVKFDRRWYSWAPRPLRRGLEVRSDWRYLLLKSGDAPVDRYLRALAQLRLPICLIRYFPGMGIEAIIRLDARSREKRAAALESQKELLRILGADPWTMGGFQVARLCHRLKSSGENGQRLLYLDPKPDGSPICEKPQTEGYAALGWNNRAFVRP
jgi:hypothetical protein